MTTIITRVFPDATTAEKAASRLNIKGIPVGDLLVIGAGDRSEAMMRAAQVHETAVPVYMDLLTKGNTVLVIKATYKPLGVVRMARDMLGGFETIDTGKAVNDHKAEWVPEKATSILKDHPLFLSLPGLEPPGRISTSFGMSLLKEHKKKRTLISSDRRMSRMFWPMPLVSKKKRKGSIIKGGRQMSKVFWPSKLISRKPRRKSVIPGGGFPFSRRLGLKIIS